MLGAELLTPVEDVIGSGMRKVQGIHHGWFFLYHVCGVWFIVERILVDHLPVALIADHMRLGNTHCALAMLLYLKYIRNQAAAGRPLPCSHGKSVAQFEQVLRIFDTDNEM